MGPYLMTYINSKSKEKRNKSKKKSRKRKVKGKAWKDRGRHGKAGE